MQIAPGSPAIPPVLSADDARSLTMVRSLILSECGSLSEAGEFVSESRWHRFGTGETYAETDASVEIYSGDLPPPGRYASVPLPGLNTKEHDGNRNHVYRRHSGVQPALIQLI